MCVACAVRDSSLLGPSSKRVSGRAQMTGDLTPTSGTVQRHSHLSIGRYHQHSMDQLEDGLTVLDFFQSTYPPSAGFKRTCAPLSPGLPFSP